MIAFLRRSRRRLRARLWGLVHSGVAVGAGALVGARCRIIMDRSAHLELGANCEIDDGTTIAIYGNGHVILGEGAFLGHHCTVAARDMVSVGAGTFFAEMVSVRDHDHDTSRPPSSGSNRVTAVVIGKDVWLGAKVTVLRGARIGDRTVVGANAVVSGELPSGVVAVGIPARVIRKVEPSDGS